MAQMIQSHDGWVLRDEWTIYDVGTRLDDEWGFELTEDECLKVLQFVADNFDCNDGINWDAIDAGIEALYGDRKVEE